jgi:2-C-methyl-D-erythritol 2,4-cyclodiphosphate synthase
MTFRIGNGFDVHKFAENRDLWLCGVKVPHTLGLLGHSDADVALHALCDALLGAAALRDIGYHFPDTDPAYKGADSRRLLRRVVELIAEKGYETVNVDVTIIAQAPKLLPYIEQMRATVAQDLGVDLDAVSVKATTTERLGFTGRGEGIAAQATALIARK